MPNLEIFSNENQLREYLSHNGFEKGIPGFFFGTNQNHLSQGYMNFPYCILLRFPE